MSVAPHSGLREIETASSQPRTAARRSHGKVLARRLLTKARKNRVSLGVSMGDQKKAILVVVGLVLFTTMGSGWVLLAYAFVGGLYLLLSVGKSEAPPTKGLLAALAACLCAILFAALANGT